MLSTMLKSTEFKCFTITILSSSRINGEYALMYFINPFHRNLQTQIDTLGMYGEDRRIYKKVYDRAPVVHLKDFVMYNAQEENQMHEPVEAESNEAVNSKEAVSFALGYGEQNFPAILTAAEEAGAEPGYRSTRPPFHGKTLNGMPISAANT